MNGSWFRGLLCVVVASIVAPASVADAGPSEDAACQRLGTEAGDTSGNGLFTAEEFAVLTGCHLAMDGAWFFPDGPDDDRLPGGPILTTDEAAWVAGIEETIREQIAGLWEQFDAWWQGELHRLEGLATDSNGRLVPGHGPTDDGYYATDYNWYVPIAVAYVQNPSNAEVGSYAGWWYDRRLATLPPPSGSPMFDTVMLRQIDRIPWPWELADPVTLAEFFRWALDHGYIDPVSMAAAAPTTEPSSASSGSSCAELDDWVQESTDRVDAARRLAPGSVTPATAYEDLSEAADAVRELAAEQEVNVPPSARARNAIVVDALLGLATAIDGLADAYRSGDGDRTADAWRALGKAKIEMNDASDVVEAAATGCEQ